MYCSFALITYNILESNYDNTVIPSHKIYENKISITLVDELGKEFQNHERLFSIEAKFTQIDPLAKVLNGTNDYIKNIPVTNCIDYQNENPLFKKEFENLARVWPSSRCLNFENLDKKLYGRYASLSG
jgi:hypothetical protein